VSDEDPEATAALAKDCLLTCAGAILPPLYSALGSYSVSSLRWLHLCRLLPCLQRLSSFPPIWTSTTKRRTPPPLQLRQPQHLRRHGGYFQGMLTCLRSSRAPSRAPPPHRRAQRRAARRSRRRHRRAPRVQGSEGPKQVGASRGWCTLSAAVLHRPNSLGALPHCRKLLSSAHPPGPDDVGMAPVPGVDHIYDEGLPTAPRICCPFGSPGAGTFM